MTSQGISMSTKVVKITFLIIILLLLFACDKSSDWKLVEPTKHIDSSLIQLVEEGWDKNLFDINKDFPSGKLNRGDIKERITANYFVGINLLDIGRTASARFYQDEESLQKKEIDLPSTRKIFIQCDNKAQLEEVYNKILVTLQSSYPKAWFNKKSSIADAEMHLSDFDRYGENGLIIFRVKKGSFSIENELIIDIQYTKEIPISAEKAKEIIERFKQEKRLTNGSSGREEAP